ncbi:hypothetical protein [Lichenicoccus sp.]|uniref:hypothetical protein n=1 Tax=Lichenicoccus sp. TaxID=2781899 RepID=UPI003D0D16AA
MDSIELNKIMAAFVIAGAVFALAAVLGRTLVRSHAPEKPAFTIPAARPKPPIAALPAQ